MSEETDHTDTQASDLAARAEPERAELTASSGSYDPVSSRKGNGAALVTTGHEVAAIDEVIDVERVARLLHVGRNTVYALVARNAIPHRRLGKQIRFNQAAVMRWLDSWSLQGAKERQ
jgi:excisionase family DNA binding protein